MKGIDTTSEIDKLEEIGKTHKCDGVPYKGGGAEGGMVKANHEVEEGSQHLPITTPKALQRVQRKLRGIEVQTKGFVGLSHKAARIDERKLTHNREGKDLKE